MEQDDASLDSAYSCPIESKPADASFLESVWEKAVASGEGDALTVLDVGCGDWAQATRFFAQRGAKVTACDISESACKKAKQRCVEAYSVVIVQDDMLQLGNLPREPKGGYDIVSAFYSLHHIQPDRIENLLRKLISRLKPGGILAIAALADMAPTVVKEATGGGDAAPSDLSTVSSGGSDGGNKRKRGAGGEALRSPLSPFLRSIHPSFASLEELEALCRDRLGLLLQAPPCNRYRHQVYESQNEFPSARLYFTALQPKAEQSPGEGRGERNRSSDPHHAVAHRGGNGGGPATGYRGLHGRGDEEHRGK